MAAVEQVLKTVLYNHTGKRRIHAMGYNIESLMCNYLQITHFTIQLDETTLIGNEALLLSYVHFILDREIPKELLFAKTLTIDTKGECY